MTEHIERRRPDWERAGGVSTMDVGQFADVVASARVLDFTPVQLDTVRDVLHRARAEGADMVCLDPTASPSARLPAFGAILRPAIARGEIPGVTLSDTATLAALFDAALGWGPAVQPILDDADVTELKLLGRTALADGQRGRILVPDAYTDVAEPGSRVRALAQMIGVTWDATHPTVTIPLANKTRMHATSTPMVANDDQLIIFRRGRTRPWTLADQVARQALDDTAAALLRDIIQAQPSILVSGAQNAGKTTMLECILNELPPNLHLVLVEDNTDEFCLATPLVTRLQAAAGSDSYTMIVRETLRMTPDLLVPSEIRGVEAGAIAQMAEAGRPTLTTIHARTPLAALHRFARLSASDILGNSFALQRDAALRVICESFQLVIHTQYLRRLGRRVVRSAALLDGVDATGTPVLEPLIEAVLDASITGGVRWVCHANLTNGALVWADGRDRTPLALAEALFDLPCDGAPPLLIETSAASVTDLFMQVRELLPYAEQAPTIGRLLNAARDLDADPHALWSLAERVLATNTAAAGRAAEVVETTVSELTAALAARDLAAAAATVDLARNGVLIWVALHQSALWVESYAAYETLRAQVEDVTVALAEARQLTERGDIAAALRRLQGFHVPSLPFAQAQEVLSARIGLLHAQQQADPLNAHAITQQLLILFEQQRRLQESHARTSEPHADVPSQATSVAPPLSPADVSVAEASDSSISAITHPIDVAAQPSDTNPPDAAAPALTGLEDLPIRFRAAAEVGTGSWAALFAQHPERRHGSGGA